MASGQRRNWVFKGWERGRGSQFIIYAFSRCCGGNEKTFRACIQVEELSGDALSQRREMTQDTWAAKVSISLCSLQYNPGSIECLPIETDAALTRLQPSVPSRERSPVRFGQPGNGVDRSPFSSYQTPTLPSSLMTEEAGVTSHDL